MKELADAEAQSKLEAFINNGMHLPVLVLIFMEHYNIKRKGSYYTQRTTTKERLAVYVHTSSDMLCGLESLHDEKRLPSFWIPSLTPSEKKSAIKKPVEPLCIDDNQFHDDNYRIIKLTAL